MRLKILLAGNHRMVLDAIRFVLDHESDMEVVETAEDGRAAVRLSKKLQPDVVVLDVAMRGINGIDATRMITSEAPDVRVIGLSVDSDRRFAVRTLQAGARGYLLKESPFRELVDAIRAVAAGRTFLSPKIVGLVAQDYARQLSLVDGSAFSLVTPREREVLQLVAEGKTTKEIAASLYISVKTVETFRLRIMKKLNRHSVAELTKYAISEGLTSVES